jgi:chromosome partitioning protein
VVIIDCPPRLTTGAIQAICAGTHLLVPTILDAPSSEAVVTFVRQIERFKEEGLCPYLQYVGVVASMVAGGQNLGVEERRLTDRLRDSLESGGGGNVVNLLPPSTYVPDSVKFRDAAERGIAYLSMGNAQDTAPVKKAVRELADVVRERCRYEGSFLL